MRCSAARTASRASSGSAGCAGSALAFCFIVLLNPVFLPYGALLNATFSKVASQFVSFSNFTFHNIYFVFFELSATKLALYNTFVLGIATATIGTVIAVVICLSHHARGGHRTSGARLPRHRAGRHPGHRARRRPVPELHPAAVRALRHAVDSAARLPDARACRPPISRCSRRSRRSIRSWRTPAASSARRGCARCGEITAPLLAHLGDRDLVLRVRRHHPRAVGRGHAVHLGDQGDLGPDLRPQRERRPRRRSRCSA